MSSPVRFDGELRTPFDLSGDRERKHRQFRLDTTYDHYATDGKKARTERIQLRVESRPSKEPPRDVDRFTCVDVQLQVNDEPVGSIPQLANWTYPFDPTQVAPIWGIPQDRFAVLSDSRGLSLSFEARYAIYTSFIDFHMINDSFSRPTKFGSGIQHLKEVGDRVVHPASHIEAPISFGTEVRPGSTFRNGEVSLDLRGVGNVDGQPCALVGYDVSDSALRMTHVTPDGTNVAVEGMSQFRGEIYVDLSRRTVRKATIDEHLIAQARAGAEPPTVEYTVRHILFRMVHDA